MGLEGCVRVREEAKVWLKAGMNGALSAEGCRRQTWDQLWKASDTQWVPLSGQGFHPSPGPLQTRGRTGSSSSEGDAEADGVLVPSACHLW